MKKYIAVLIIFLVVTACYPARTTNATETMAPPAASTLELVTTALSLPTEEAGSATPDQSAPDLATTPIIGTATPDTRKTPKYWREWPIVPTLSDRAISILKSGVEAGNDIHSFSRIGDCQSVPDVFMGIYSTDRYKLPEKYPTLPETIVFFGPSFTRASPTAKDGFGVSSVLSSLFTNPDMCQNNETPLGCEIRRSKPVVAFIAMGTNWQPNSSAKFEQYLHTILDTLIKNGTLPVIVTKPDNIEGDWMLNLSMAKAAYEYDIPLVNVWRSVQYLPNHGLDKDNVYMNPSAWDERNLASLRTLDAIRQELLQMQDQ